MTGCGHVFCCRCIIHWLYYFSSVMKCPVCRRIVITSQLSPRYNFEIHSPEVRRIRNDLDQEPSPFQRHVPWEQFMNLLDEEHEDNQDEEHE
ncbi:hypothetical protein KSP40_PGU005133 [Platanthera guangdongensis]|uniref:RING-type domain-containing protein n=1 Tax=Platanthera guangdongensis TaxID=2320717 RepID=A0ABR2LXS2_9ASPA